MGKITDPIDAEITAFESLRYAAKSANSCHSVAFFPAPAA